MKTPEQIAHEALDAVLDAATPRGDWRSADVLRIVVAAIEADRAQRDIYELAAEALDERADWEGGDGENAQRAAALLRAGTEDYIWDRYIGPMIDDLMDHLGEPDETDTEPADPCIQAGEHQFRADHRSQECPIYHEKDARP